MVKTLTKYKCEICDSEYSTFNKAAKCEEKGREKSLASVGDYAVYRLELDDNEGHITLDVRIREIETTDHSVLYRFEEEWDNGKWYESMYTAHGNKEFKAHVTLT